MHRCFERGLGALGIKGWQLPARWGESRTIPREKEDRGLSGSCVEAPVRARSSTNPFFYIAKELFPSDGGDENTQQQLRTHQGRACS